MNRGAPRNAPPSPTAALLTEIERDRATGRDHALCCIEEMQRALLEIASDLRNRHSFGNHDHYSEIERAFSRLQDGRLRDAEAEHYSKCIRNLR